MKRSLIFVTLSALLFAACNDRQQKTATVDTTAAKVADVAELPLPIDTNKILSNFGLWWEYNANNIRTYEEFIPADLDGNVITKAEFFGEIATGNVVPLKKMIGDKVSYQLFRINPDALQDFEGSVRAWGDTKLRYYLMEGKPLPEYRFAGINGVTYTPSNTLGKVLVIKCWFISCLPCVQEMPALNMIVEDYKDRRDILFLGLAIDHKKELESFLKKTPFFYNVVSDAGDYMSDKLHIAGYPTHILVDKKGLVVKVLENDHEVKYMLAKELAK